MTQPKMNKCSFGKNVNAWECGGGLGKERGEGVLNGFFFFSKFLKENDFHVITVLFFLFLLCLFSILINI
jgi:hypothetical protein